VGHVNYESQFAQSYQAKLMKTSTDSPEIARTGRRKNPYHLARALIRTTTRGPVTPPASHYVG